jgi:dipeptidyl aminopeptidase/acylaminoacyl peptidase
VKLAVAGLAAAAVLAGTARSSSAPSIVFAADRLPAVSGEVYRVDADGTVTDLSRSPWQDTTPIVSPNGKLVAFLSGRDGGGLYVVGIDGAGLRRVAAAPSPWQQQIGLAWAPDSSELALATGTVSRATLSIVPVVGGSPRVIAHASAFGTPAWSPDGTLITVGGLGEVDAYTAAGAHAWSVTSGGNPVGWSAAGFYTAGAYDGRFHIVDENGKQRFSVAADTAAWSPGGREIATIARRRLEVRSAGGALLFHSVLKRQDPELSWVGATQVALGYPGSYYRAIDVRTGKSAPFDFASYGPNTVAAGAAFAVRFGSHVYTHVPGCYSEGGAFAATASLQSVPSSSALVYQSECPKPYDNLYALTGTAVHRLTNAQLEQIEPQLSPDGTRVAYAQSPNAGLSCQGCPETLWVANADGSHPVQLTTPVDLTFDDGPTWSPDGSTLLFDHSTVATGPTLQTLPAAGGTPTDLGLPGFSAAWGPTRIAYVNGTTNPTSLWTALPSGKGRQEVGTGNITSLAWSHDGRLAYLAGTTATIVSGAAKTRVELPFQQVKSIAWSTDGTHFLVAARAKTDPVFDAYLVKTDGTDAVRLTQNLDVSSVSQR